MNTDQCTKNRNIVILSVFARRTYAFVCVPLCSLW